MKKEMLIGYILNTYGGILNKDYMYKLLYLNEISDNQLKKLFIQNDPVTKELEEIILKSYQSKLLLKNIEFKELDGIENITCDDLGNKLFILQLRWLKAHDCLADYFEENNINSISREYFHGYDNAVKIGKSINELLNIIANYDYILKDKINSLNQNISNDLMHYYQMLLIDLEQAKLNIDIFSFDDLLNTYYLLKINLLTLYNPSTRIELEEILKMIDKSRINIKLIKNFKEQYEISHKINQNILKTEDTLIKILHKN